MTKLLSRVEQYINFEEILKFAIGIEVPVNEPKLDRDIKKKDKDDRSNWHDKRSRFEWKE